MSQDNSEPHIVSEPLNPLELYRRLQMAEGRVAELEAEKDAAWRGLESAVESLQEAGKQVEVLEAALRGILAITDRKHVAWDAARAALSSTRGGGFTMRMEELPPQFSPVEPTPSPAFPLCPNCKGTGRCREFNAGDGETCGTCFGEGTPAAAPCGRCGWDKCRCDAPAACPHEHRDWDTTDGVRCVKCGATHLDRPTPSPAAPLCGSEEDDEDSYRRRIGVGEQMNLEHEAEELLHVDIPADAGGGYLTPTKATILDALQRAHADGRRKGIVDAADYLVNLWDDEEQGPPRSEIEQYAEILLLRSLAKG